MNNKKVSIIVPVYNVEKYLDRCLHSLINQTYENIEIILINDGSKDSSYEICKKYENCDSRVVLINKENAGVSSARNDGLEIASGDFIMFVDSDDWVELNMVEECILHIKNYDLLLFPYIREYGNKSITRNFYNDNLEFNFNNSENELFLEYIGPFNTNIKNPVNLEIKNAVWGKFYKKELLKNISFYDYKETVGEDLLFNIKYSRNIKNAYYLNIPFYHYNKCNSSSLTNIDYVNFIDKWKKMFSYIEEEIDGNSELNNRLDNRVVLNLLTILQQIYFSNNKFNQKIKNMKFVLNDDFFVSKYSNFSFKHLDFKWKIFYFCCKHKLLLFLSIMLKSIKILKKKV